MLDGIIRRFKFEIARRVNRYRQISSYRSTYARFGSIQRVILRNAAGVERRLDLRADTSDLPLFLMTFRDQQYDLRYFSRNADVIRRYHEILARGKRPLIIDAGANIGLASLYFRDRYPEALIVGIEPERDNFIMAQRIMRDDPLFLPLYAGLANFDGSVALSDPGLGAVGFRTEKAESGIPAYRLETIIDMASERCEIEPFILKVDIEGFERDLFDNPVTLDSFYLAFIELHDWMLPKQRTSLAFLKTAVQLDRDFLLHGENVVSISNDR